MHNKAEEEKEKCPFCLEEISWPIDDQEHVKEFFPNTATYARAHKACVPEKGFREWLDNEWYNNAQPVSVKKVKKTKKKT